MEKGRKTLAAKVLEVVARKSVEIAADCRCMYLLHQPKQPDGIKRFKK